MVILLQQSHSRRTTSKSSTEQHQETMTKRAEQQQTTRFNHSTENTNDAPEETANTTYPSNAPGHSTTVTPRVYRHELPSWTSSKRLAPSTEHRQSQRGTLHSGGSMDTPPPPRLDTARTRTCCHVVQNPVTLSTDQPPERKTNHRP